MRFVFASIAFFSLLVQNVLSSSAMGHELVQMYYIYRMECMVYGPDKTKLLGDNPGLPPKGSWFKPPYDQMPIHPRPKGTGNSNGMLTFFEFEKDLADPNRVNNPGSYGYNMADTSGGRMTTNPDGKVIGPKLKGWGFGAMVSWRVTPEIYNEVLADWNQQKATNPKQANARYTGAGTAEKMGNILRDVRRDFDNMPNKGIGLASAFDDLFDEVKKNLDDSLVWRRFDNAQKTIDWYEKEKGWARKDLVIEKVTLPDGRTFDDLNTDKTVAGFNGDAAKLSQWQANTAELSGPAIKKYKKGDYKLVASHLNVIQAWQRVQSAAKAPVPLCS